MNEGTPSPAGLGPGEEPREGDAADARPAGRAIDPAALGAATAFVSRAASEDAGALFRTVVELRLDRPAEVLHDAALLAFLAGLGPGADEAEDQLRAADRAFEAAFGSRLLVEEPRTAGPGRRRLFLTADIAAAVDGPAPCAAAASADEAVLDAASTAWVAIAAAAVRSGRGHHLALRAEGPRDRALADFAEALAGRGVDVLAVGADERPAMALLRCELHAGSRPAAVVLDCDVLRADAEDPEPDDWDAPAPAAPAGRSGLRTEGSLERLLPALPGMRCTCIWRVPAAGTLPRALARVAGGPIGPVAVDPSWALCDLLASNPPLGRAGAARLLAAAGGDPRDARALAALAEVAMATPGLERPDEACRFVAAPLRPPGHGCAAPPAAPAAPSNPRLFACGPDGLALLGRGEALARGCRVLATGGPGSGKSTYVAALAEAVARASGRTVAMVEPAWLLARAWGATERRVQDLFRCARAEHQVLVADEVDSLCTRREADGPAGGNAYLIRCLTNEFLRQLDAHPDVPFLASTNAEAACDPAFLRRVTAVVPIADALAPEQEALAWEVVLGASPPDGWTPAGCAVADFAAASRRCGLVGRDDPESLAEALEAARRTRLGRAAPASRRDGGLLH